MTSAIQHFHFEPGTLIAYVGHEVVVTGPVKGGVAVRDRHIHPDQNLRYFVLDDEKVNELLLRHDVVDAEFSSDAPDDPDLEVKESAFEDQPPDVRHSAYQKEAFCRPVKSVLKGPPFYQSLIKANLTSITKEALARQKLNASGNGRKGVFNATEWGVGW